MKAETLELAPATTSARRHDARLLVLNASTNHVSHRSLDSLVDSFRAKDLLIVNDAATLPSSFIGVHEPTGRQIELRLAVSLGARPGDISVWLAVVFGEGDWRDRTECRVEPPQLSAGHELQFSNGLNARIENISSHANRLVEIRFQGDGDLLWQRVYAAGAPIQYSYLESDLAGWDQQTIFAGEPIAVEPPSSAFHLSWALVFELQRKGVEIVAITHGTGLSTTGDDELDRLLPFPERSYISANAAARINAARKAGRRIYALGTGATRALESAAMAPSGAVVAGHFVSTLKLSPGYVPKIVDGLFTGIHESGSSHLSLLESFVPPEMLSRSYKQAIQMGYLGHEYGDVSLVVAR